MKVLKVLATALVVLSCQTPTDNSSESYKLQLTGAHEEWKWVYRWTMVTDSPYFAVYDSAKNWYERGNYNTQISRYTSYRFTRDSVFREIRNCSYSGLDSRCYPFEIMNGDTVALDSTICMQIFSEPLCPQRENGKGLWECTNDSLRMRFLSLEIYFGGRTIDTMEVLGYRLSQDMDTMYISQGDTVLPFVKTAMSPPLPRTMRVKEGSQTCMRDTP